MQTLEPIQQNLEYILKALKEDTHRYQRPIIRVMLIEAIEEVEKHSFQYEVPFSTPKYLKHVAAFYGRAKQAKYKLLAALQELESEIDKKKPNKKRCEAIINQLLRSDLCQDEVNKLVSGWTNTTAFKLQYKTLYVEGDVI